VQEELDVAVFLERVALHLHVFLQRVDVLVLEGVERIAVLAVSDEILFGDGRDLFRKECTQTMTSLK
jgi:hypothetical protein